MNGSHEFWVATGLRRTKRYRHSFGLSKSFRTKLSRVNDSAVEFFGDFVGLETEVGRSTGDPCTQKARGSGTGHLGHVSQGVEPGDDCPDEEHRFGPFAVGQAGQRDII